MRSFEQRFEVHARQGLRVERALDIGAYRGEFTGLLKKFWPRAQVWQFEADERQRARNPEAFYVLLGDSERECDFFTVDETRSFTTGSSIYMENTEHYRDPIVLKLRMSTIDALMNTINFAGDWRNHGLVKIDTQGSEIDILKGARKFLSVHQPLLILLETSFVPYNKDAPLIAEVFEYMTGLAYRADDIFDLQRAPDGRLVQADVLFRRL